MKNQANKILVALSIIALFGCKDIDAELPEVSSVTIVNAITDAGAIKVNNSGRTINWATYAEVAYGSRGFYNAVVGSKQFVVVPSADTTKSLVNTTFNFERKIYTLYLSGSQSQTDVMLKEEENFPFIKTVVGVPPSADSVVNVRFVNLAVGSPALKVKIMTGTTNEVDSLPYKGISDWKKYPAKLATTAYSFQIRDAVTDALVTTYSFSATATNRFKNVTLLLRGIYGTTSGTVPFGVVPINYF